MSQYDDPHPSYDNTHRAFLQVLLGHGTLTFTTAQPILAAILTAASAPDRPTLPGDITISDFESYIHSINAAISPVDLEVRSTLHQATRQRSYALVNTTSDALTQFATIHSPEEIAFVKRVLDAMFDTFNTQRQEVLAVTSMQALKLAKPVGGVERRRETGAGGGEENGGTATAAAAAQVGLTMSQAERVLTQMVQEGWFELSQNGYYSLAPRALMELRGWLMDTYNEPAGDDEDEEAAPVERIKFCQACREIVTVGQRCANLSCVARAHDHCIRNIFRARGNREECPVCATAWIDVPPVGEKAARRATGSTTNGARRSTDHRQSARGADDSDG